MKNIQLVDLYTQYLTIKKEIDFSIKKVIGSSSFILGKDVEEFENEFAQFNKIKYCAAVSSGTDALFLSLKALGIRGGDEVITSTFTFTATAEAISMCGARPVFVDIDPDTYNIDPEKIEEKITKKTKGIIPVHLYGQPCDMLRIKKIAKKHKIFVLEDCAQAHGAKIKVKNKKTKSKDSQWKNVGNFGQAAIFSFYPGKNLGCYGDGGAVVTNSREIYEKVKLLRNHGREEKYVHKEVGFGCRMDTIQAAILRVKLKKLQQWNKRRREIASLYGKKLAGLALVTPFVPKNMKPVFHLYVIRLKNRDKIREELEKKAINTGIHYPIPLHLQPAYKFLGYIKGDFSQAEQVAKEVLSLPISADLSLKEITYICTTLKGILDKDLNK